MIETSKNLSCWVSHSRPHGSWKICITNLAFFQTQTFLHLLSTPDYSKDSPCLCQSCLRIKRKNPSSPYRDEVSDAGFPYTNARCLAIRHCSQIPSLGRGAGVWGLVVQHYERMPSRPNSMPNRFHNGAEASALVFLQDSRDLWSQISNTTFRKHTFLIWGGGIFPFNTPLSFPAAVLDSSALRTCRNLSMIDSNEVVLDVRDARDLKLLLLPVVVTVQELPTSLFPPSRLEVVSVLLVSVIRLFFLPVELPPNSSSYGSAQFPLPPHDV